MNWQIYDLVNKIQREQVLAFEKKLAEDRAARDKLRKPDELTMSQLIQRIEKDSVEKMTGQKEPEKKEVVREREAEPKPVARGAVPPPPISDE